MSYRYYHHQWYPEEPRPVRAPDRSGFQAQLDRLNAEAAAAKAAAAAAKAAAEAEAAEDPAVKAEREHEQELRTREHDLAAEFLSQADRESPAWGANTGETYKWQAARRRYVTGDDSALSEMLTHVTHEVPPLASLPGPRQAGHGWHVDRLAVLLFACLAAYGIIFGLYLSSR